jgi:hypothetical protein
MKKYFYLILLVCITLTSCGLKGKIRAWAQKNCECRELKGIEKKECKDELREMELNIRQKMASLSEEERKELHEYEEEIEGCSK